MEAGRPANAAIYAEQVATAFRQLPIALAVNLVNATLTAIVLAPLATRPYALPFLAAVVLATAARLVLLLRYRRASVRPEDAHRWSRLAACGSLITGLAWGIGGATLFSVPPVEGMIFLTIVIGGMCAGAVVVNAAHLPTLLSFILSASLPMAARFFLDGNPTDSALGAMTIVFAVALGLAGSQLNRILSGTMRLRWELDESQRRLRAETAERLTTEAALHQAQKLEAIGHLTGGIAHDFNNLMTVVIGNLLLASERTGEAAAVARPLQAALHAAERGAALIQRLLAFARKQHLDPRSVDLAALVFGIEELLRGTLGPQIRLVIAAAPSLAPAHVDANQVELAILNLTINAQYAMPDGGTVRIGLENRDDGRRAPLELTPGDYVVLSISDDGAGMDEATLARAFEPFFTTKEIGRGSGLGLSMVQGFAVQSGGAARIASRLGEGTTVELWLPRADDLPAAATAEPPRHTDRGAATVLLCDDDDDVRGFLREFLASIGYTVREASGGEAALRMLQSRAAADLLIVDYVMPGINGLETIRQARLQRPNIRSLLISGYAGNLNSNAAGVPFLRKPFAPDELARRIAEILAA
jgi:signal transduction histidine kinase